MNVSLQKSFQELLRKQNGDRAIWEYPFAVAGVNITFMLIQMLDLQAGLSTISFKRIKQFFCLKDNSSSLEFRKCWRKISPGPFSFIFN